MKKTSKKTARASGARLSADKLWLRNPLFIAALLTIMAVVALILADDWLALKKSTGQPAPSVTVKVTPTPTVTPAVRAVPTVKVVPPKKNK